MAVLIDSNIFILAERFRQQNSLTDLLSHIPEEKINEDVLISVITASELLRGVHRAGEESIRQRRIGFVDAVLDRFKTMPINLRIARQHSRLSAHLMASGQSIGIHDSWIAASALSYGFSILTSNAREFGRVPDLEVIAVPGQ